MKFITSFLIVLSIALQINAQEYSMKIDTLERTYRVYVPEKYAQMDTTWMVLGLHGSGESGEEFSKIGFNRLADEMGFIAVYPDGRIINGNHEWNNDENDVQFINSILDTMIAKYKIDTNRMYSTGYSAGGFFSYDLTFYLEGRLAGVAPMAGLLFNGFLNEFTYEEVQYDALYDSVFPTPILHIHSVDDQMVSYNGSGRPLHHSVEESLATWIEGNKCAEADTFYKNEIVTGIKWADPIKGNDVVFYKYPAGMHTKMRYAVDIVCDFFYNHPKREDYIEVTAPSMNDFFTVGDSISISADTYSSKTVTKVAFYANGELLGEDTEAPYQFQWKNAEFGEYTIRTIATFEDGKQATSSTPSIITVTYPRIEIGRKNKGFDNNFNTRWESSWMDNAYLKIDLGAFYKIHAISLFWEIAYGEAYKIQVSEDNKNWTTVYETNNSDGDKDLIEFDSVDTRYVKIQGVKRALPYGYSLWEVYVHGAFVKALPPKPETTTEVTAINYKDSDCLLFLNRESNILHANYQLPKSEHVQLSLYDINGVELKTFINENQLAGIYNFQFELKDFETGVYIVLIEKGSGLLAKKILID